MILKKPKSEYNNLSEQRLARINSDKTIDYYLNDHPAKAGQAPGSARTMTSSSWSANYYPFGEIASQTGSPEDTRYDYTGQERDRETGLIYFGARYLDPEVGRWMSVDPFHRRISKNILSAGILSESPYLYTSNNPIKYIDRSGLIKWDVVKSGGLKFAGGVLGLGIIGYTYVQTGGVAAIGGATVLSASLVTSIAAVDLGFAEIVAGFADKDFPIKDGYIVTTLIEAGIDKNTASAISTAYDLLKTGVSASEAISKTGTSLNALKLLLNADNVSEDVKKIILEEIKKQEYKEKEEEQKRQDQQNNRNSNAPSENK